MPVHRLVIPRPSLHSDPSHSLPLVCGHFASETLVSLTKPSSPGTSCSRDPPIDPSPVELRCSSFLAPVPPVSDTPPTNLVLLPLLVVLVLELPHSPVDLPQLGALHKPAGHGVMIYCVAIPMLFRGSR